MKNILTIMILTFYCLSSKAQLKIEELKKDTDFIAYKKISAKLRGDFLSHYYGPSNKYAALSVDLAKAKSPDDMKAILKTNGIPHADEFVNDLTLQTKSMTNFIKNHPEINSLPPAQRNNVLTELIQSSFN